MATAKGPWARFILTVAHTWTECGYLKESLAMRALVCDILTTKSVQLLHQEPSFGFDVPKTIHSNVDP